MFVHSHTQLFYVGNTGWCQSLNRCSDGVDRFRQEWIQSGCHLDADLSFCTAPSEIAAQASEWQQPGSIAGIFIGILVLLTTVILISVCVGVAIYGYRHPASRVGMYMIEVRKGRFKTNRVDTYDVREEQLTSEE